MSVFNKDHTSKHPVSFCSFPPSPENVKHALRRRIGCLLFFCFFICAPKQKQISLKKSWEHRALNSLWRPRSHDKGKAGPLGQIWADITSGLLINMLHNNKNTVTPLFVSLSLVSDGWSCWVWESRTTAGSSCALASGLLSQDCVRGCKSSKGGGLGPEPENRWGGGDQDSVCRDLFYFIFLISNWLCFPALVVFSVRRDLIWLLF